jgi:hypothetical protein
MKLLTKEILKQLPKIGETEQLGLKAKAIVKFFSPTSSWTWYASEFDGVDQFFGLVDGFKKELGYFSLTELQSVKLPFGLTIERDLYFTPKTFEELMKE